jgi:WD40 repeat protein
LITGCGSGKVLIWNDSLDIIATFNISSLGPILSSVYAIHYDPITTKILLGLESCEIFEMDSTDGRNIHFNGGPIVTSHYAPRICGLSPHPYQSNLICTVGDDKTIRIYDIVTKKQLKMCSLDAKGYCVTFSQDGNMLLVGYGSGVLGKEEKKEGAYVLINSEDLTILHEARDSKMCLSSCGFTSDNERYAFTSHDNNIYLYSTKRKQTYAICRGHTGKVITMDFSTNNQFMMTNTANGELLYWDITNGLIQPPKAMKNIKWETNTCPYSFGAQSFWTNELYNPYLAYRTTCKTHAEDVIFAVDNFGSLLCSDFPCFTEVANPSFSYYYGHSKGIMNCRISCDDKYLFTSGENDGSIFQWRLQEIELGTNQENLKKIDITTFPKILTNELAFDGKALEKSLQFEDAINYNVTAINELEEGIQEPKAMVSWQKSVVAPSVVLSEDNTEPSDRLELDYVYGFTNDINHQSLQYLPNQSEIVFFLGSIGIIMNPNSRSQRYYREHNSKILCMAINKEATFSATGKILLLSICNLSRFSLLFLSLPPLVVSPLFNIL